MVQTRIHDAARVAPRGEVGAHLAFELLIGLSALTAPDRAAPGTWVPPLADCSTALRRAVERVGEQSGELWLHLLGLALDAGAATAEELVAAYRDLDAHALRRHLVGVHVPAWQTVAGVEALEGAAAGDAAAVARLFANERYYAGRARASLERVLRASPAQAKRLVLAVLERFADEVLAPEAERLSAELERERHVRSPLVDELDAVDLVAAVVPGYTYVPEAGVARVLLVPHLAARPWLLLCQHRATRIICYPIESDAEGEESLRERALAVGRALAEPGRIAMARRLAAGEAGLDELAAVAGVARSTAHHHLGQLRAAGIVEVRGNARAYLYSLSPGGLDRAAALMRELAAPAGSPP